MNYLFYIILGLAPSFIWLLFFLRKDSHPESNKMILKIFLFGMLAAVIAALVEIGFENVFKFNEEWIQTSSLVSLILYLFIGIALVEEIIKYLVVRIKVINNPEFDEPVDAMLYMIIAALGFAALENMLVLLPGQESFSLLKMFSISVFRFIGATFLHALCSGLIGYFLALSFFRNKRRSLFIIPGLAIAVILHGFYNLSIMKMGQSFSYIIIPIIILIGLAIFVSFGFTKLKKIKSTCKI